MASEREFRLGYWPLYFNLEDKAHENAEARQKLEFFRAHLTIHKGAFFQSPDGKLNGYQTVAIRDARKFITVCNERISAWLTQQIPETLSKPIPPQLD